MNILFALAIAMAVGMAMTRLIKLIHLPNVTAYLIAGLLVGPYVLKVLTPEMNSKLSIISDVALGFIAYSIGSEFKFSYIKEIGAKPMVITAFEGCVASLLVFLTLLVKPLIEIVGSLAMGVLIGTVMVFCLRFFHSRGNKLTMTILIVFLAVGLSTMLDLSSLLVCMMIGATMINVSNDSPALLEQCDRFTPPLFLLFFVLSGASLDLSVLPTVGVVGIAYVLSRAIGKSLGATIGAAIEKCDKNIIRYLGMTLIPQAGVAIGMARMCLTDLPAYGPTINAVVLAGTLIYELTGPVITKIALTKAGEIKEGGAKPAAVTAAK